MTVRAVLVALRYCERCAYYSASTRRAGKALVRGGLVILEAAQAEDRTAEGSKN